MNWVEKLRYPMLVKFHCPKCGAAIGNFSVNPEGTPFSCPACDASLCAGPGYAHAVKWGCPILAAVLSLPILWLLSFLRWQLWLGSTLALTVLFGALVGIYGKIVFPPKLQLYMPEEPPLTLFRRRR